MLPCCPQGCNGSGFGGASLLDDLSARDLPAQVVLDGLPGLVDAGGHAHQLWHEVLPKPSLPRAMTYWRGPLKSPCPALSAAQSLQHEYRGDGAAPRDAPLQAELQLGLENHPRELIRLVIPPLKEPLLDDI